MFAMASASLITALAQAQVVQFKDADKIRSWDAWNDHKPQTTKKEQPCD
jgi:hypothetical protein